VKSQIKRTAQVWFSGKKTELKNLMFFQILNGQSSQRPKSTPVEIKALVRPDWLSDMSNGCRVCLGYLWRFIYDTVVCSFCIN
jgi:hypothetical protein